MSKRKSIEIAGAGHGANPIPAASLKDGLLISGAIYGWQPGDDSADGPAQCLRLFDNIAAILAAGGGSPEDIVRVSIRLADAGDRPALNDGWVAMFPDPGSRPARHVEIGALADPRRTISAEIVAMITAT